MIKAIAIVGPTAVGKTAFAIALAEKLCAEIISCDSMQIYRGMDIGTAKATADERAKIPHHMLDIINPDEKYSAADYASDALACARDITERGRVPVFCGGTGLYLDAVRTGRHADTCPNDPEYAASLFKIAEGEGGIDTLHAMLAEVDAESAEKIHKNNVKRVIRALEIHHATGISKSELDKKSRDRCEDIDMLIIGLDASSREILYQRIDRRVDKMIAEGLLEETRALYNAGYLSPELTAAQAIGYKEILPHITDGVSVDACALELKTASRRYAKRQLTWFRANPTVEWIITDENGEPIDTAVLVSSVIDKIKKFIYGDKK